MPYDYIVVGGGTAGCVVAARLAQNDRRRVLLVEAGPTDEANPKILTLSRWQELLETELDYDYRIEPQPHGNDHIRHSRGKMLGGCSSHNSAIAFIPPDIDFDRWADEGASGWSAQEVSRFFDRVQTRVNLEKSASKNACVEAFLESCAAAGYGRADFARPFAVGADWFRLNKTGARRASSSVAYLHPTQNLGDNLEILTDTRVERLVFDGARAVGIETAAGRFEASESIVLCAGAFDTPKLLMRSGVGPADHLRSVGVEVLHDRPGVGSNLLDHPEGVMIWGASRPVPARTAQRYEAGLFVRVDDDAPWPDLMFHFGTEAFDMQTKRAGYATSDNAFSLTPNVTRARSAGTVRLRDAGVETPPRIDFAYFADPYDERIMTAAAEIARDVVRHRPLADWVDRELAPGTDLTDRASLSEYLRRTANTVYHPAGTCRMGQDGSCVVDPTLAVTGLDGLRIADASVFPSHVSVNPCLTVMMIGERCADFLIFSETDREART
ncbi:MAG: GMC family oxidoreductase N-terminal domain-containing protein [Deltaproteobacteria bacterium]|jgi:choline oxidase